VEHGQGASSLGDVEENGGTKHKGEKQQQQEGGGDEEEEEEQEEKKKKHGQECQELVDTPPDELVDTPPTDNLVIGSSQSLPNYGMPLSSRTRSRSKISVNSPIASRIVQDSQQDDEYTPSSSFQLTPKSPITKTFDRVTEVSTTHDTDNHDSDKNHDSDNVFCFLQRHQPTIFLPPVEGLRKCQRRTEWWHPSSNLHNKTGGKSNNYCTINSVLQALYSIQLLRNAVMNDSVSSTEEEIFNNGEQFDLKILCKDVFTFMACESQSDPRLLPALLGYYQRAIFKLICPKGSQVDGKIRHMAKMQCVGTFFEKVLHCDC
jgi:hypothetical protein